MGGRGGSGHSVPKQPGTNLTTSPQRSSLALTSEQRIQRVIKELVQENGGAVSRGTAWVSIADVRDRMNMDNREFDQLVRRMSTGHSPVLMAVNQANQKVLTERQRAGSVLIGNEFAHIIRIT